MSGCGNVAPAPRSEMGPGGCQPATDEVIVADAIIELSVVITEDVDVIIEDSDVSVVSAIAVFELLIVVK